MATPARGGVYPQARGSLIRKREVAVTQLVAHVHDVIETTMLAIKGIVIGGDFNTNHDQEMFAAEKTPQTVPPHANKRIKNFPA